jgi:hypothetical protein
MFEIAYVGDVDVPTQFYKSVGAPSNQIQLKPFGQADLEWL